MAERTRTNAAARSGPASGAAPRRRGTKRKGPTPKGGRAAAARERGRYTAPIPQAVRHSPPWYPWLLLGLLFVGVVVIILNYVQALPASPTNWYTLGGIVALLAGAVLATNYR